MRSLTQQYHTLSLRANSSQQSLQGPRNFIEKHLSRLEEIDLRQVLESCSIAAFRSDLELILDYETLLSFDTACVEKAVCRKLHYLLEIHDGAPSGEDMLCGLIYVALLVSRNNDL